MAFAPIMERIARGTRPLVRALSGSTDLVLRLLRVRDPHEPAVTAEDVNSLLEQGADDHAASFERIFATPHGVDLAAICAGTGTPHTRVTDRAGLETALARTPEGIEVVEAVVRRDNRRALDAALRALVTG